MAGLKCKQIVAAKQLSVNVNGIEYEVLMIPKDPFVEVDYSMFPEDHPKVRALIEKLRRETIQLSEE